MRDGAERLGHEFRRSQQETRRLARSGQRHEALVRAGRALAVKPGSTRRHDMVVHCVTDQVRFRREGIRRRNRDQRAVDPGPGDGGVMQREVAPRRLTRGVEPLFPAVVQSFEDPGAASTRTGLHQ